MSARIQVVNFPTINIKERSRVNVDANAADVTVVAESTQNIAINDILYIGKLGTEECERRTATGVSGFNVTVAALTFAHKRFEDITNVAGDQVQLYRAANVNGTIPADTSFSVVGSPVSLDPDQLSTNLTDGSGGSGYWYKYTYYNSVTSAEVTALADVQAVRGGSQGRYTTTDDVRAEAGFRSNQFITESEISTHITAACNMIDSRLFGIYSVPFTDPVPETVRNLAKVLAAGYLLKAQYGIYATGTNKDGNDKIYWALGDPSKPGDAGEIGRIIDNTIELFDLSGTSLRTEARVHGWPDSSTATQGEFDDNGNNTAGGSSIFNISHKF